MRPHASLYALLLAFLVVASPLALASGESHSEKGRARAEEAKAASDERRDDDRDKDPTVEAAHDDREARENRSAKRAAFIDALRAQLQKWRDAWKENATAIRASCHAVAPDHENATKEEHRAWAHCIRDGYHSFLEALRLERKAWRAEWRADWHGAHD